MTDSPGERHGLTPQRLRSQALGDEANAFRLQARWLDSLTPSLAAVEADPSSPAAAHNLSVLLTKLGRLAEGEEQGRRALALAPGSPIILHSLAHNLLAQGRFVEAWPYYDARANVPELRTGFPTDFPFPRWRGEPLAGKRVTVFPEQGYGDQIQFSRFLPNLIAQGARVTLLTVPSLVRLFERNFPDVEIVVASGSVDFPDPDFWTTLHELPAVLGITLATIPGEPYLSTDIGATPHASLSIGLMTKGNPRYLNDKIRSLPDEMADRLRTELPGTIVDLDPKQSGAEDFAETAAIISGLDLVVSVDTSVAHLAGALGKPCLLLIPGFSPDWRWGFERKDSPWYCHHRLYRSGLDGDWAPTIDRLVGDVQRFDTPARHLMREAAALREEGRFSESLAAGRKALAADPKSILALHNMGRLLDDLGRPAEGEKLRRRAVALAPAQPKLRHGLGLNLLAQGRYREAWPLYEARSSLPATNNGFPQNVKFPRWQGEDCTGKRIAVFPEQGLGDQIQFARFLPWLRRRGAEIVVLAPAALVELFRAAFPQVSVVPAEGSASFPKCHAWTTIVDLARHADITIDTIPPGDYLREAFAPQTHGTDLSIGVMTRGNPAYIHDAHRSLPENAAAVLRHMLPGTLVELDPAISGACDFADTARLVVELDLVVSVDTSVGHLAGAMGKPCLLLIGGFASDWRWLRGRDDSPWYPSHRLFRGEIDGNWDGAIARLADHARSLVDSVALPS